MAPISVLPGRIRFEIKSITGRRDCSSCLERELNALEGVTSASVNHRTGRCLVEYDDEKIDDSRINDHMARVLEAMESGELDVSCAFDEVGACAMSARAKKARFSTGMTGKILLDLVSDVLLPAPFNLLVPVAVHTIKR